MTVDEHCRLVLWRLGRIPHAKPLGPGRVKYYPDIDSYTTVKIQLDSFNLNDLELMTKDMYGISASFQVFFRVVDPIKALINVQDYRISLDLICRSKLRDVIGKMTSDDLKRPFPKTITDQLLVSNSSKVFILFAH